MPITVADLQVRVAANVSGAQSALRGIQGQAETTAGRAGGAFARMAPQVGRAMVGAGAVIGAGMASATVSAATLADEMANVATVVPDADLAGLTDEVQALSRASGETTTDLTAGLYDLVSAGVSAEDAMGVLSASTNLAIGGLGTTAGAADIVTSAMNSFGLEASEAGRITDVFALAIQKGKVTADEIGASISNIAPVAASAGISLEEVSAGYAALTAKGVPAAQAATQMRAAISALLTPNEALNRIQAATGKNFADIAAEEGLAVALEELRVATEESGSSFGNFSTEVTTAFADVQASGDGDLGPVADVIGTFREELGLTEDEAADFVAAVGREGMGEALAGLQRELGASDAGFAGALGSVEALQFAVGTTGDEFAGFQQTTEEMFDATGTAAEQAAIKMDSPVEAAQRLAATFQTFMQDVGGPFAQSLGPILIAANQIGPAFGGIAKLSTILGGGLGALGGKFVTLAATAVPAVITMAAPFAPIILAVGLVVAAVAGLFLAWQTNFLGIRDIAGSVVRWLEQFVVPSIKALFGAIVEIVKLAVGLIGGILGVLVAIVKGVVGFFSEVVLPMFTAIWKDIATAVGVAVGLIAGFIGFWTGIVKALIGFFTATVLPVLTTIWNGIASAVKVAVDVIAGVIGFFTSIVRGILDFLAVTFGPGIKAVWDGIAAAIGAAVGVITGVIGGIIGVVQGVWDVVAGFFDFLSSGANKAQSEISDVGKNTPPAAYNPGAPSYQSGAYRIMQNELAYLHAGEMVLPPVQAEGLRSWLETDWKGYFPGIRETGGGGGAAPAAPAGDTIIEQMTIHVPIQGLLRAETPNDVASRLRSVADAGYLTPRAPR